MSGRGADQDPRLPDHKCGLNLPAGGTCAIDVPYGRLFDPAHWRMVPRDLQREVTRTWANGAGAGSGEHNAACQAARAAVEAALLDAASRHRLNRY